MDDENSRNFHQQQTTNTHFQLFINMNSMRPHCYTCCSWKSDPLLQCACYPVGYLQILSKHCTCCHALTMPCASYKLYQVNADVCWSPSEHDKMSPKSDIISAKLQNALLGNMNSGALRRPVILDAFSLLGKNFFTYEACKPPRWRRNMPCTCGNSLTGQESSEEWEESPRKRRKVLARK